MYRLFILLFMVPLLSVDSCTKVSPESIEPTDLSGKWVLKNYFLGDAIDTPCGYENANAPEITFEISQDTEKNNTYKFSGKSTINSFFGSLEITDFDTDKKIASIAVGAVGSTKMAGPPELMQCESRFFEFLSNSKELKISEGKCLIGTFPKTTVPSRDGGTYLIFEKK